MSFISLQLLPFSKSLSDFQHNSEEFPYLYRQDPSYDKEAVYRLGLIIDARPWYTGRYENSRV